MSDDELREMEGTERENVEARIRYSDLHLKNVERKLCSIHKGAKLQEKERKKKQIEKFE